MRSARQVAGKLSSSNSQGVTQTPSLAVVDAQGAREPAGEHMLDGASVKTAIPISTSSSVTIRGMPGACVLGSDGLMLSASRRRRAWAATPNCQGVSLGAWN